mmetsp:Transcript_12826/g.22897  ORF Transcript_12826/g.22897 Transcript_12826/m.22897 type:complete len:152 (+) Transcript_12826:2129-2584(+)
MPRVPLLVLNFEVFPPVEAVEFAVTNSTFAFEVKAPLPGAVDTVSLGFNAGNRILTMTAGGENQRAFLRALSLPMAVDEAKIQSYVTPERKLVLYLPKRSFAVGDCSLQESKRNIASNGDSAALKRSRRLDSCQDSPWKASTVTADPVLLT